MLIRLYITTTLLFRQARNHGGVACPQHGQEGFLRPDGTRAHSGRYETFMIDWESASRSREIYRWLGFPLRRMI